MMVTNRSKPKECFANRERSRSSVYLEVLWFTVTACMYSDDRLSIALAPQEASFSIEPVGEELAHNVSPFANLSDSEG